VALRSSARPVGDVVRRGLWDNALMSKNRTALYVGLMVLAAAVAGYMVSRQLARGAPTLQSGTALPSPRVVKPFALTDDSGNAFGNAQLVGRPSLVFFGFTHCPDVCPVTLALLAQLRRDPALASLRMLFVTVDPSRDTQQAMHDYVGAFGQGITGLRGEDAALEPVMQNLGAARSIEPRAGEDYSVDHSAALYYVNARGQMSAVFTPPFSVAGLGGDLTALISSGY
jgi:protein SCO1/2